MGLGLQDRCLPFEQVRRRDHRVIERVGRSLVQGSRRVPGRLIAFDPAVEWIGGGAGDPTPVQCRTVHPGAVHIPVEQEHRPIRLHGVEVFLAGCPAGEVLHRPSTADDPRLARVSRRVGSDGIQVGLSTHQIVQPHPQPIATGKGGMDMAVLETRKHQPSWCGDYSSPRAYPRIHFLRGAERHDSVAPHGDPGGPRRESGCRVGRPADPSLCDH